MQIQNLHADNYNNSRTSFKSWNREVYRPTADLFVKELSHRNDTRFFRNSSFWQKLVNMLVEKYKNTQKVNVYCYGCSNGSEPYTFIMQLMSTVKENIAKKFLPIIAKDYDSVAIDVAKRNSYAIGNLEMNAITNYTNNSFDKFFEKSKIKKLPSHYSVKSVLTDNVQFSVANVLEDYTNIEPDNTVVFARNFWPYLSNENQKELAEKMYKQLGENSTLIIGDFDLPNKRSGNNIPMLLLNAGFNPADTDFVFVKN